MALVLIGFILIALIDLIPLIRRRTRRGIVAFLVVYAAALTLAVLQAAGAEVPSSMIWLGDLIKAWGLGYPSG